VPDCDGCGFFTWGMDGPAIVADAHDWSCQLHAVPDPWAGVFIAEPRHSVVCSVRGFFPGSRAVGFVVVVAICGGSDIGERLGLV
jgi:hypothetical protein